MWGDDGRVDFAIYLLRDRTFNDRARTIEKIYNENTKEGRIDKVLLKIDFEIALID